jgi:alpha-tubulin suppressor-like RCC1 family protein
MARSLTSLAVLVAGLAVVDISTATTAQADTVTLARPWVSGMPAVGQTLTVSTTTTPTDVPVSYVWERDGVEVGTGTTYLLAPADAGHQIEAVATAEGADGATASVPTAPVVAPGRVVTEWGSDGDPVPSSLDDKVVTAVAAGFWRSLALTSDGAVTAWGLYSVDGNAVPSSLSGKFVTAVSTGYLTSLALTSDGKVTQWGSDSSMPGVPATLDDKRVVAVAAARDHNLALTSDGTVVGWGDNSYGETNVPAALDGKEVVAIAGGSGYSLALTSEGVVVAWGDDHDGQIDVPAALNGKKVVAIAAEDSHSLALTSDGTVLAWGDNSWRESDVPGTLDGKVVTAIAAGGLHSLALTSDGTVTAWGDADPPEGNSYYNTTAVPAGLTGASAIAAGEANSLAIARAPVPVPTPFVSGTPSVGQTLTATSGVRTDADVSYVWRRDGAPVGTGSTYVPTTADVGHRLTATATATLFGCTDGVARSLPTATVTAPGRVSAWGGDDSGQAEVPASLDDTTVTAVAAGSRHSLALSSDGHVTAWGDDTDGQTDIPRSLSGKTVTAVAAGYAHSLALTSDGHVTAWGRNDSGQTTIPAALTGKTVIAIAAGGYHSLALTSDGTVVAWGNDSSDQTDVPAALSGATVLAIAAGGYHSLALTSDGTVVAWGDDTYGQSDVPAGLTAVTAIAAGGSHSLALRGDGTVVGWGSDNSGQASVPASLHDAAGIAAGSAHSLAVTSDGHLAAWGSSGNGRIRVPAAVTGLTATAVAAGGSHSLAITLPTASVPVPTIAGHPNVGQTLTAAVGASDPFGIPSLTWQRDDDAIVGSGSTYQPTIGDLGHTLRVTATVAGGSDHSAGTATSGATGPVGQAYAAPSFTSANAKGFTVGVRGSFTVTTTGYPRAALSVSRLPGGLSMTDHGDGTATVSGTPSAVGTSAVTVTATSDAGTSTQAVTFTVSPAAHAPGAAGSTSKPGKATPSLRVSGPKTVKRNKKIAFTVTVAARGTTPTGTVQVRLGKRLLKAGTLRRGTATLKFKIPGKAKRVALTVVYLGSTSVRSANITRVVKVR